MPIDPDDFDKAGPPVAPRPVIVPPPARIIPIPPPRQSQSVPTPPQFPTGATLSYGRKQGGGNKAGLVFAGLAVLAVGVGLAWKYSNSVPTHAPTPVTPSTAPSSPPRPQLRQPPGPMSNVVPSFVMDDWSGGFKCGTRQHTIEMKVYPIQAGTEARVFVAGIGAALYRVTWHSPTNTLHATPVREVQHIVQTTWLDIEGRYDSGSIQGVVFNCGNLQMSKASSEANPVFVERTVEDSEGQVSWVVGSRLLLPFGAPPDPHFGVPPVQMFAKQPDLVARLQSVKSDFKPGNVGDSLGVFVARLPDGREIIVMAGCPMHMCGGFRSAAAIESATKDAYLLEIDVLNNRRSFYGGADDRVRNLLNYLETNEARVLKTLHEGR